MDVKQYGPALFPTLKQVRRLLDEAEVSERHRSEHPTDDTLPTDGRSQGGAD